MVRSKNLGESMSLDNCLLKLNNIKVFPIRKTDETHYMITAFDNSEVGYFEYHSDKKVMYVSDYITEICELNFSEEITLFEIVNNIFNKQEQFSFLKEVKAFVDGSDSRTYNLSISSNNKMRMFEFAVKRVEHSSNYVGTMRNIDAIISRNDLFSNTSTQLDMVFRSIPLPVYYYDLNGNLLFENMYQKEEFATMNMLIEKHVHGDKLNVTQYPWIHFFEMTHYSSTHNKFEIHFDLNQNTTLYMIHRVVIQNGIDEVGLLYLYEDVTDVHSDDKQLNKLIKANELIIEIKDLVDQVNDLNSMYNYLLSKIHIVIPSAKRACVLRLDSDDNMFITASYGFAEEYVNSVKLPFSDSFANSSLRNDYSKSVILNDIQDKYSLLYPDINENTSGFTFESNMTAPLVINGALYGLLSVDSDQNNVFDAIDLNLLDYLKVQIERAIVKYKTISRVKRNSIIDPLTGIFNRRHLMDLFEQYSDDAQQLNSKFAFVLFDIDKLKKINDSFGHVAGDKVIKQLAFTVSNQIRETDIIARIGGDEFIGLFWNISKEVLTSRIKGWQELLELETIDYENNKIVTKFSYGISVYPDEGKTFEELLKESDTKMYTQKL